MHNVCLTVPDSKLMGVDSTFQCVECGHVWKVLGDENDITKEKNYGWDDIGGRLMPNEEYESLWNARKKKFHSIRKNSTIVVGIILLIVSIILLFTPTNFDILVGGGAVSLSFIFLIILNKKTRRAEKHLAGNLKYMYPIANFSVPKPWPCLIQENTFIAESRLNQLDMN